MYLNHEATVDGVVVVEAAEVVEVEKWKDGVVVVDVDVVAEVLKGAVLLQLQVRGEEWVAVV